MLLTDADIRARGIVENGSDNKYRDTGYDLTVDLIIDTKGNDYLNRFSIASSGIVELISAETLRLPPNVTGFAHVKTSLVEIGLLPLNIGIIDPGWNGRISATLLNFGDGQPKMIQKGEVFLRVTFIEHEPSTLYEHNEVKDPDYINAKRAKIAGNFGETFLGWGRFKKTIAKITDDKIKKSEARILPTRAALIIAGVGLFLVGVQLLATYLVAVDPFHWIGRKWDEVATTTQVEAATTQARNALATAKVAQRQIDQLRADMVPLLKLSKPNIATNPERERKPKE